MLQNGNIFYSIVLVELYGSKLYSMVLYGNTLKFMILKGTLRYTRVLKDTLWHFIILHANYLAEVALCALLKPLA